MGRSGAGQEEGDVDAMRACCVVRVVYECPCCLMLSMLLQLMLLRLLFKPLPHHLRASAFGQGLSPTLDLTPPRPLRSGMRAHVPTLVALVVGWWRRTGVRRSMGVRGRRHGHFAGVADFGAELNARRYSGRVIRQFSGRHAHRTRRKARTRRQPRVRPRVGSGIAGVDSS